MSKMTPELEEQVENLAHDAKAVAFAQMRLTSEPSFNTDPSVRESVEGLAMVLAGQLDRMCELLDGRGDAELMKKYGTTMRGPAADARAKAANANGANVHEDAL